MSVILVIAIVCALALGREWFLTKQTGWDRLAQKYRSSAPFAGKYRACWWAQFALMRGTWRTVANVGRMTRVPIRFEFPPIWIGASAEGLYLKRNIWNVLHPALRIPWNEIHGASEVTYEDLIRSTSPSSALAIAVGQGLSCKLLELKLSDPALAIVAQVGAFEEARPFLSGKLKLLSSESVY
jgi:hypothetical protein